MVESRERIIKVFLSAALAPTNLCSSNLSGNRSTPQSTLHSMTSRPVLPVDLFKMVTYSPDANVELLTDPQHTRGDPQNKRSYCLLWSMRRLTLLLHGTSSMLSHPAQCLVRLRGIILLPSSRSASLIRPFQMTETVSEDMTTNGPGRCIATTVWLHVLQCDLFMLALLSPWAVATSRGRPCNILLI